MRDTTSLYMPTKHRYKDSKFHGLSRIGDKKQLSMQIVTVVKKKDTK
jgi:hypothetical protein